MTISTAQERKENENVMTIKISVEDTIRAAKKALDEGRLAAFHPDFQKTNVDCAYRYPDYPGVACAVGAGISDEATRQLAERDARIDLLTTAGIIEVATQNPSVKSWMREWEARALAAEADAAKLREALERAEKDLAAISRRVPYLHPTMSDAIQATGRVRDALAAQTKREGA